MSDGQAVALALLLGWEKRITATGDFVYWARPHRHNDIVNDGKPDHNQQLVGPYRDGSGRFMVWTSNPAVAVEHDTRE